MKPIRRIAFMINAHKEGAVELGKELEQTARGIGCEVRTSAAYPVEHGLLRDCDACCVIGGDGTLLGVVAEAVRWQVPVFGVNQGKLGFLATYSVARVRTDFAGIVGGDYRLVARGVLECGNPAGEIAYALNDMVIKSARPDNLIGLRVHSDGELVTDFYADGLILSTATGSTAYNLSAGGPIILPQASVFVMTPICPHTLSNRSVVMPSDAALSISLTGKGEAAPLATDGLKCFHGDSAFPLEVRLARSCLHLLQPSDHSHFHVLRTKLGWGGEDRNRQQN